MKRLAVSALTALLLAGGAAASLAQAPALAPGPLPESVPSDLPRTARPLSYRIEVVPDAADLTFTGTTSILLEVYEETDALTLHANELDIETARLTPAVIITTDRRSGSIDPRAAERRHLVSLLPRHRRCGQ